MSEGVILILVYRMDSGRYSVGHSALDLSRWSPLSIVRQAAEALWRESSVEPFDGNKLSLCRRALNSLGCEVAVILNRPLSQLEESEVLSLLQAMERDFVDVGGVTPERVIALSIAMRQFLCRVPGVMKNGQRFQEVVAGLLPSLRRRPKLRRNDLPAVIGHLHHVDWEDLRHKAQRQLELRHRAIEQAIAAEFQLYERVVKQQAMLFDMTILKSRRRLTEAWLDLPSKLRAHRPCPPITAPELAAIMLQRQESLNTLWRKDGWPKSDTDVAPRRLRELEGVTTYRFRYSLTPWLWVRYRLPNVVLTSIFVALLLQTGWNQGAVGSLTVDDIVQLPQGGYRLQGYKGKTDDHTPVVEVSPSQRLIHRAIELLLWNHRQLQVMGLLEPAERRLWFGWQKDGFVNTTNVVDDKRIAFWCQRHGVEVFSPSSLRPLRAALTYLPQRDLEAVRVLLGHNDLIVTDGYLQDTLFFRLNEANMLQFQRRVETSLVYGEGGDAMVKARALDPRDIDPSMLLPTGDGGACADVFAGPPLRVPVKGEPCAGLLCQQGDGCPQYRLVVTEQTLEMALRTRRYYRSRWSALASANPEAFARLHLPRLLYIHVLLTIVHAQRPDLLRRAEGALA